MMTTRSKFAAAAIAIALLAVACGDDGDGDTATTTTKAAGSTGGTAATGATTTAATCKLDAPLKIVGLFEKKGESANAIDDFNDGAQMAVDEINAAAGVCGQKIDWERLPASPTDTNQAKNQYLAALDKKAHITLGPISSTVGIPIAAEVKKSGVPALYMSVAPQFFTGGDASADNLFLLRPPNTGIAALQADYVVKDLGKKNIGLVCVEQPFGQQGCDAAQKAIEAAGAKVAGRETNATTAQDLTAQVLSLKGKNVDAIITFNFPNPLVVLANQMADNGITVPLMAGSSAGIAVASGSVKAGALTNLYGTDDCAPSGDAKAKAFADAFEKKYNKKLAGSGYGTAEAYDGIKIAAAAVAKANSVDPKKLTEALKTITYEGVCDNYKSDGKNGLHDGQVVTQFDAKGIPSVKKSVTVTL